MHRTRTTATGPSFWGGFEKRAKDVFVYRNVHKSKDAYTYSLRSKQSGRVEDHRQSLYLKNPRFSVGAAGRDRVRREGRKNVHAGIHGKLRSRVRGDFDWRPVTYDPKKHETFIDRETGAPLATADVAKLTPQGVFAGFRKAAHVRFY